MSNRLAQFACLSLIVLAAAGCKTYQEEGAKMSAAWQRGDVASSVATYTARAEKRDDTKDALIWRLEQATTLRAAGRIQESTVAFDRAEAIIDDYEVRADVKLAGEAGATMSNQANLPYRGRAYDKIMVNIYKALNYMEDGEFGAARSEIFRSYQRQQDAVVENNKRIESAIAEEASHKDKASIQKARENGQFRSQMDSQYGDLDRLKAYGDYVNPFAVFLDGLYFLYHSADGSDLERSRKSFERMLGFTGENEAIMRELERVETRALTGMIEPTTYVIVETGSAPVRDQIRIDIPIIVTDVSYIGAAFPKLSLQSDYHRSLVVSAEGSSWNTITLASMDGVIGKDFEDELPIIITKTLISTVAKGVAAYAVNHAAEQADPLMGMFSRIGTAIGQAAVNIADLRTWTTLPKEFQYISFPTPENKSVSLRTPNGAQSITVQLGDGDHHVVYVRSVNTRTPLWVSNFRLQ